MGSRENLHIDDDFGEIYEAYTGPSGSNANNAIERTTTNKRSHAGSDEEEDARDPNAVPTDFTSREAKVWEAKSKATERNWKKRKEEEMICKICGESGHFTQGCPTTLGANRKSQDFFERRVPAREAHIKALFTEKVVNQIENDIGCKITIEEKFIIVSGKDRLMLKKGVDVVRKIKEEGEKKGFSSYQQSRSRSPKRRSPVTSRLGCSDSQRFNPSPHGASQLKTRFGRQEKFVEDHVREDFQRLTRGSLQAYGNDGARGRSSQSRSPVHLRYGNNSYNSYDVHGQGREGSRTDGWDAEGRGSDMQTAHKFDYPVLPQILEELELVYEREASGLRRMRDKEEDEENYKHRQAVREISENYIKKGATLRATHAKQWDEFLQHDAQKMQQQEWHNMLSLGFGRYKQSGYPEFENPAGNPYYLGSKLPMHSRSRYPNQIEDYPLSRPPDPYGDLRRQRRDGYGKNYNRY